MSWNNEDLPSRDFPYWMRLSHTWTTKEQAQWAVGEFHKWRADYDAIKFDALNLNDAYEFQQEVRRLDPTIPLYFNYEGWNEKLVSDRCHLHSPQASSGDSE